MSREWLIDVGALAAALTAVLTFVGVLARSRVGRWLAAKITDDLRANRRAEICELLEPIRAELRPNGGKSLRDAVDLLHADVRSHLADDTRHVG